MATRPSCSRVPRIRVRQLQSPPSRRRARLSQLARSYSKAPSQVIPDGESQCPRTPPATIPLCPPFLEISCLSVYHHHSGSASGANLRGQGARRREKRLLGEMAPASSVGQTPPLVRRLTPSSAGSAG